MKQYLDLLQAIKDHGTDKPGAREGMPGSRSLFGYQFRHDLSTGFPALTTKKLAWKTMVVELLWFLRGDTNIKYLVDNGCNIWNEDAYNYYSKRSIYKGQPQISYDAFIDYIKDGQLDYSSIRDYKLGDCGFQYGKVWRDFNGIDQISRVIKSLKTNPESRRHLVTAVDPAHDKDLALYWCHSMFQFNCRPLTIDERSVLYFKWHPDWTIIPTHEFFDSHDIPKYYLDCQLYQRSADAVLGVPFNIASYSLLTHIIARVCNMIPGDYVHTFGDVHIYDNHWDAVDEQLSRRPGALPKLESSEMFDKLVDIYSKLDSGFDSFLMSLLPTDFQLTDYNPQPSIKAELSTGLKK